jgi:hypothetical protein
LKASASTGGVHGLHFRVSQCFPAVRESRNAKNEVHLDASENGNYGTLTFRSICIG